MARQKLGEVRQKELMFQARFEESRSEAIEVSGQLAKIEILERDVKRLSDMNDLLMNQIASLGLKQNGQEVRVTVIRDPEVGEKPVSPLLHIVAGIALVGGFAVGLTLVHLLDALDDRFRTLEEIQSRLSVSVLSAVPKITTVDAGGLNSLALYAAPTSAESESFRTLRTALQLSHPDARQIVMSSSGPGDGKTTVLANLAVACAQCGREHCSSTPTCAGPE